MCYLDLGAALDRLLERARHGEITRYGCAGDRMGLSCSGFVFVGGSRAKSHLMIAGVAVRCVGVCATTRLVSETEWTVNVGVGRGPKVGASQSSSTAPHRRGMTECRLSDLDKPAVAAFHQTYIMIGNNYSQITTANLRHACATTRNEYRTRLLHTQIDVLCCINVTVRLPY